ncbi:MAG: type VI secretion system contractile sheath small subunit [Deltaproteobacteria bacterium]|jgi:type VI secretion system protein ImpB|nr:type VI secretion system contractile sheath small subunit [Deltaproteobacteria bacterium]
MADNPSVAPKERVNIVYKSAVDGAQSEVELPNKLLVLGDFTQQKDERAIEDRAPISVDKDNFNDVLKSQDLKINLSVPDKLSDQQDSSIPVSLNFTSLKDFEPDSVAQQIPEVAKLLELREALKALRGPLANVPDFRKKIQEIVQDEQTRAKLLEALNLNEK